MTKFLLKGLLRDRHRSLFPVIIVSAGVAISVLLYCWATGVLGDIVSTSAKLETGHVKIMTQAYEELASQLPNDLAIFGLNDLLAQLQERYPDMDWAPRTKFGGLLDIPDENGETRAQSPVFGLGIDLLSPNSKELERFNMHDALVQGRLPQAAGEIVISEQLAQSLQVQPGETATLISATSNGGMAIYNFILVGTVRFGVAAMDTGAMLVDISDIQYALDMADATGELLGFFPKMIFDKPAALAITADFNAAFMNAGDEYSPTMLTLLDQNGLGEYLAIAESWIGMFVMAFIGVMSIVLWNTGLISGIRRYGEVGVRLAIGESKGHVYSSLLVESVMIGIIGSVIGTVIGLFFSYLLQEIGLDVSAMMQGATMMMSNVMRARVTPPAAIIGFIPGLLGTVFGAMLAGIGIFQRQTSQLFKELET
jgi:putative ABC transport system permease protein